MSSYGSEGFEVFYTEFAGDLPQLLEENSNIVHFAVGRHIFYKISKASGNVFATFPLYTSQEM